MVFTRGGAVPLSDEWGQILSGLSLLFILVEQMKDFGHLSNHLNTHLEVSSL